MSSFVRSCISVLLTCILYFVFALLLTFLLALLMGVFPFIAKLWLWFEDSNLLFHIPHVALSIAAMYVPAVVFRALTAKCSDNARKYAFFAACILVCLPILFFYTSSILHRAASCIAACAALKAVSSST